MKNSVRFLLSAFVLGSLSGCVGVTQQAGPAPVSGDVNQQVTQNSNSTAPVQTLAKNLDATECNPGVSIEPVDKGKTIQSTDFKYTLLDVRQDDLKVDPILKDSINYDKVLLVKLQVENISQHDDQNLSIAEVDLTRNSPPTNARIEDDKYQSDIMYPHTNICVSLAGDVGPGTFPKGKKVVGYYVYGLPKDKPFDGGLFFGARYFAAEDVETGKSLNVAGVFKLK